MDGVSLGELFLQLRLDVDTFNQQLQDVESKTFSFANTLEGKLNLKPKVDHSELFKLNQHLEFKKQHFQQVQNYFDSNPLKPRVDTSELDTLSNYLEGIKKQSGNTVEIKVKTVYETSKNSKSSVSDSVSSSDSDKLADKIGDSVEKGVKEAMKRSLSGNVIGGVLSGAKSVLSNTVGALFRGALEGVGKDLSTSLGVGLASGLEQALSSSIGSGDLVGKKIAKSITGAIGESLNKDLKNEINDILTEVLGKENILISGGALRGKATQQEQRRIPVAREQLGLERKDLLRQSQDLQAERSEKAGNLDAVRSNLTNRDSLQSVVSFSRSFGSLTSNDAESISKYVKDKAPQIVANEYFAKQAKLQESRPGGQLTSEDAKTLKEFREKRLKQLEQFSLKEGGLSESGIKSLEAVEALLSNEIVSLAERERELIEELGLYDKKISEVRKKLTVSKENVATVAPVEIPKAYKTVLKDVNGGKMPSENLVPKLLVADEHLENIGAVAQYGIESNTVKVTKELYDAIHRGELTLSQIQDLYHELQHAKDFGFGQAKGVYAAKEHEILTTPITPTAEELKQVAPLIGQYAPEKRMLETNAEVSAIRNAPRLFLDQERQKSLNKLQTIGGYSGGGYEKIISENLGGLNTQFKDLAAIGKHVGIDPGKTFEELDKFIDPLVEIKKRVPQMVAKIASSPSMSSEQISHLLEELNNELGSIEKIKEGFEEYKKGFLARVKKESEPPVAVQAELVKPGVKDRLAQVQQFGANILQSPAARFVGGVTSAVGQTAKLGYKVAEGVEGVVLDALPFGRTAKAIGKNVAIPAAMFGVATMLPGVAPVAAGMLHLAGGAGAGVAGHLGAGVAGQAAGALSGIPQAFGIQQAVTGAVTGLIESAFTGAGSAIAQAGAVVFAGKAMQNALGKGASTAASAVPLALPMSVKQVEKVALELPGEGETGKKSSANVGKLTLGSRGGIQRSDQELNKQASEIAHNIAVSAGVTTAEALEKAKHIQSTISNLYKSFKEALDEGNVSDIESLSKGLLHYAETKTAEINELIKTIDPSQLTGSLKSQLNQTKSTISRSKNETTRKMTVRDNKASQNVHTIDVDADELSAQKLNINPEDLAVNTAGFVGGMVGQHFGPVGALAGDLIGSLTARQGIHVGKAGVGAYRELSKQDKFKQANQVQRLTMMVEEIQKRLGSESLQQTLGNDLTGDIAGFGIGNAAAFAGNALGLGGIPAKGAVAAMATVPHLQKLREHIRSQLSNSGGEGEELSAQKMLEFNPIKKSRGMSDEQRKELQDLQRLLDETLKHADKFDAGFKHANREVSESFDNSTKDIHENLERLARGEDAVSNLDRAMGKLGGVAKYAAAAFVGWQALSMVIPILTNVAGEALQASIKLDNLKTAMNFASGGSRAGDDLAFVNKTVDDLKIPLGAAREGFVKLAASTRQTATEGKATKDLFEGTADAVTVLGLNTEQTSQLMKAYSDMASKGTVQMEELKGQLGDAGLSGAMKIAADSMGLTTAQLAKLTGTGGLAAEDFLPKFGRQLKAVFGSDAKDASKNAQSAMYDFQNSILKAQEAFGKFLQPGAMAFFNVGTTAINLFVKNLDKLSVALGIVSAFFGMKMIPVVIDFLKYNGLLGQSILEIGKSAAIASVKFVGQFALMMAAVEAVRSTLAIMMPDETTQQFNKFTDQTVNGLKSIEKAAKEAKVAVDGIPQKGSENKEERLGDVLPSKGFNFSLGLDDFVNNKLGTNVSLKSDDLIKQFNRLNRTSNRAVGLPEDFMSVSTAAEKIYNDQKTALGKQAGSAQDLIGKVQSGQLDNGLSVRNVLDNTGDLNSQIRTIDAKKFDELAKANPDQKAIERLNEDKRKLTEKRDTISSPLLEQSTKLDEALKNAKTSLDAIDKLGLPADQAQELKNQILPTITALEKAQQFQKGYNDELNKSLIDTVKLAKNWDEITIKQTEANRQSQNKLTKDLSDVSRSEFKGFDTDIFASQNSAGNRARKELEKQQRDYQSAQESLKAQYGEVNSESAKAQLQGIEVNGKQITSESSIGDVDLAIKNLKEAGAPQAKIDMLERVKAFQQGKDKILDIEKSLGEARAALQKATEARVLAEIDRNMQVRQAQLKIQTNNQTIGILKQQTSGDLSDEEAGIETAKLNVTSAGLEKGALQSQINEVQKAFKAKLISAAEYDKRMREMQTSFSDLQVKEAQAELQLKKEVNAKILSDYELLIKKQESLFAIADAKQKTGVKATLLKGGLTEENKMRAGLDENLIDQNTLKGQSELIKYQIAQVNDLRDRRVLSAKQAQERIIGLNTQLAQNETKMVDLRIQREEQLIAVYNKEVDKRISASKVATATIVRGLEDEKSAYDAYLKNLDRASAKISALSGLQQAQTALIAAQDAAEESAGKTRVDGFNKALDILKKFNSEKDPDKKQGYNQILGMMGVGGKSEKDLLLQRQSEERNGDNRKLQSLKTQADLMQKQQALAKVQLEIDLRRSEIAAKQALVEAKIADAKQRQVVREASGELQKAIRSGDKTKIAEAQSNLKDQLATLGLTGENVGLAQAGVNDQPLLAQLARQKLGIEQQTANLQSNTGINDQLAAMRNRGVDQMVEQVDSFGKLINPVQLQGLGNVQGLTGSSAPIVQSGTGQPTGLTDIAAGMTAINNTMMTSVNAVPQVFNMPNTVSSPSTPNFNKQIEIGGGNNMSDGFNRLANEIVKVAQTPRELHIHGSDNPKQDAADTWTQLRNNQVDGMGL